MRVDGRAVLLPERTDRSGTPNSKASRRPADACRSASRPSKSTTEGGPARNIPAGTTTAGEIINPLGFRRTSAPTSRPVSRRTRSRPNGARWKNSTALPAKSPKGVFLEPECEEGSEIGINHVVVFVPETVSKVPGRRRRAARRQGLQPRTGRRLGVEIRRRGRASHRSAKPRIFVHTIINGNVEWGKQAVGTNKGDFHDYFEIEVSPKLPLVSSRLVVLREHRRRRESGKGEGDFITQRHQLHATRKTSPRGSRSPTSAAKRRRSRSRRRCRSRAAAARIPDQLRLPPGDDDHRSAERIHRGSVRGTRTEEQIDVSQVKTATFTLPDGMTLNPSAAHGPGSLHRARRTKNGTERFTSAVRRRMPGRLENRHRRR